MRRLILLLVFVACRKSAPDAPPPPPVHADAQVAPEHAFRTPASTHHVDPKLTGTGKTFLVVSEDELATKAGQGVLAAGGNAVDAAVATAFALAVTHPVAGNIGGGGFAVVRTAKGEAASLDFRETAPAAATADMFIDKTTGKVTKDSLHGPRASGVPGSVAGLWALHEKLGKRPWKDVIAPAIALARDGFAVPAVLTKGLTRYAGELSPAALALWAPNGAPRPIGEIVKNPDLAAVLARIADKGSDGFYKGETAAAIVATMKQGGGLITAADLAGYKPVWREPLSFTYRGRHLWGMPPPSSGGVVVAMTANMLRDVDLGKLGWHSAQHVHELVEVWRRAFAARNNVLGDPAYVKDMPIARLISTDYADALAATIGPQATPSQAVTKLIDGTHTTNIAVVDAGGMAVALTTTINGAFGSGVLVGGFFLNNEMDDFTTKLGAANDYQLVQGAANKIEPGKRMLSSMSPTIVEDEHGDVVMVVGAGGGSRIITSVWQTISNVLDFGLAVDAAVAAPRVHHQHLPDDVVIEDDAIDRQADTQLRAMGYALVWGNRERSFSHVTALVRTAGGWQGAADPREGGAAMGD